MKRTKRITTKVFITITSFIIFASFCLPASAQDGLTYGEAYDICEKVAGEAGYIQWFPNLAILWYNSNRMPRDQLPEDAVIRDGETGEVIYMQFSPFAVKGTEWNADYSPANYYGSVSELKVRLHTILTPGATDRLLYGLIKDLRGRDFLYTDSNGKEWMARSAWWWNCSIQAVGDLRTEGDVAQANVYVYNYDGSAFRKVPVAFARTADGWRMDDCAFLEFITFNRPENDFEKADVLPENPGTADGILKTLCAYSAVALICAGAAFVSVTYRRKSARRGGK
jgi:hypothetical protein